MFHEYQIYINGQRLFNAQWNFDSSARCKKSLYLYSTEIINAFEHKLSTFDNTTIISRIESLTILFLSRGSLISWQMSKSLY